jgi:hypothetical protein
VPPGEPVPLGSLCTPGDAADRYRLRNSRKPIYRPVNYGLGRALLKLLPLSKGFNPVSLGQRERPLSKNRKVRGTDDPSIPASDPFGNAMRGLQREESPVRPLLQIAAQLPGAGGVDQFPVLRGEFEELGAGAGGSLEEYVTEPTRGLPLAIDLYEHAGEAVEQRVHPYHSGEQLFRYALELHPSSEHPAKERPFSLLSSLFGAGAPLPGRPSPESTLPPSRPLQLCGCLLEGLLV